MFQNPKLLSQIYCYKWEILHLTFVAYQNPNGVTTLPCTLQISKEIAQVRDLPCLWIMTVNILNDNIRKSNIPIQCGSHKFS